MRRVKIKVGLYLHAAFNVKYLNGVNILRSLNKQSYNLAEYKSAFLNKKYSIFMIYCLPI